MKRSTLFLSLMLLSFSAMATQDIVTAPTDHLYIPQGFDNNDNVQVVVTGSFPGPCFIKNKVEVNETNEKINIKVTALKRNDIPCPNMNIPFKEEITLGSLQAGKYEITVNAESPYQQQKELEVATASSQSTDDHIYALVEYIETGFTGGLNGDVVLMGWAQLDCLTLDNVQYISNHDDTISILPIMKKTGGTCREKLTRIDIPVHFKPQEFKDNKILIFVRTMEGKSVNTLIGM